MGRKLVAILVTVSWMAVIFYLSHQPAAASRELSHSVLDSLVSIVNLLPFPIEGESLHFFVRKSAHFVAYLILGMLLFHTMRLFAGVTFRSTFTAFFIAVLYAISDEVHQTFIPGRSGEVRDVLIDSAGALVGIGTFILLYKLIHRIKQV